jgi:ribosome-binding ATPase
MKIGIIGFPNSGKKTLYRLLTRGEVPASKPGEQKPIPGVAYIRDSRFDSLVSLYEPKKSSPAQISLELLPDFDRRTAQQSETFRSIAGLDALCLVARAFSGEAVYHVNGSVNAERDIDEMHAEFLMHDLIFIEKRLERILDAEKKGKGEGVKAEKPLLLRLQAHLEQDLPLRLMELGDEEMKIITSYPFITLKKEVLVVNDDDCNLAGSDLMKRLQDKGTRLGVELMQISARLEEEIEALESQEERAEFMKASGIGEPAINRLSFLCMKTLGLMSFFTVGKDEVKQWLIRRGSTAPQAAGAIHSDIERGFIRAELMKYGDLMEYGGEQELKAAGKYHVMGRDYVFEDGDIANFRFNV